MIEIWFLTLYQTAISYPQSRTLTHQSNSEIKLMTSGVGGLVQAQDPGGVDLNELNENIMVFITLINIGQVWVTDATVPGR